MTELTLSFERLVETFLRLADGPMEDGDVIVPQIAADHLERHGVAPGDFFEEGMRTLFDIHDPVTFANKMNFRISKVIRPGTGHRQRLWRSIRNLPADWIVRERAIAWMVRQLARGAFPTPEDPSMSAEQWKRLDQETRATYALCDDHYKNLFCQGIEPGSILIEHAGDPDESAR